MNLTRAQLYGESIFTSFRSLNGQVPKLDRHIQRVLNSVNDYYFHNRFKVDELDNHFNLRANIQETVKTHPNHYFRVTFYADSKEMLKSHFSLSDLNLSLNVEDKNMDVNPMKLKLSPSPFSDYFQEIKAGSYFQSFYFKKQALFQGYDDVLFKREDAIIEGSSSNIIFIKNKSIITPEGEGFLKGITLDLLKDFSKTNEYEFSSQVVKERTLREFDHAFLVNSVKFLIPIQRIEDKIYDINTSFRESFIEFIKQGEV